MQHQAWQSRALGVPGPLGALGLREDHIEGPGIGARQPQPLHQRVQHSNGVLLIGLEVQQLQACVCMPCVRCSARKETCMLR